MTIYVALLRGINVGGHNKVAMTELRNMFQSMGFSRVQTYIQSGNVLFESEDNAESLRQRLEQEIEKRFSISLTVILRTAHELEGIVTNCPVSETMRQEAAASSEAETFYVSFLLESPSSETIERLMSSISKFDEYWIHDKDVYLLLRGGVRNSRLANQFARLRVPSTMRNWGTVNKLNDLAKAMEE
ncbi:DUF1697 domain-containing protein [Alicyclobacillus ferrooxydans]|uniref:Cytoplasmic protein n=1 Tax=Alicyclobacillus ferrooxydans TaxID=471514 RepID=A0A0P9CSF5_9BACL|nr:DUF1697 domain-containing protein [Alicyclobacillus ferrooxydans]KPV42556.1 cytoplasmic protein [Alicyclobacillus ferrooxydans]